MFNGWSKTHKCLPRHIQCAIEETLCVTDLYNLPKELMFCIIKRIGDVIYVLPKLRNK